MVLFYGSYCSTFTAYINPESPTDRIGFKDDNGADVVKCIIRGRDLVFGGGSINDTFYIFDFDFDEQHKKAWNLNEGQYLLQLPNLLQNDFQQPIFSIIKYAPEDGEIQLAINGGGDDGYQPICANADLSDIDVGSWFNNATGETAFYANVAPILSNVLAMEYSSFVINIEVFESDIAIDGTFNPYTDGDDFTPLRIVSRFAIGSPIIQGSGDGMPVCRFNRATTLGELHNLLTIVAISDAAPTTVVKDKLRKPSSSATYLAPRGSEQIAFELDNTGKELMTVFKGLSFRVFDIDLTQGQYRRPLTVDGVGNYGVTDIDFLNDPTAQLCLQFGDDTDQSGYMGINIPVETGTDQMLIREPGDTYTFDQTQHAADFVPLIQAIAEMEFGFVGTVATVEVNTATGNGGVDLFTVRDIYARN